MGVFVDREKMRKTPRSPPPRYDDIYAAGVAAMDESDSGAPNASLPEPSSAGEPNPFVMAGGVYMGADGQWKKPGAGEPERPVCKTCGDTGRMLADADPIFENRMPCPDCGCQGVRPDTKERP
jgi:hypothetical protein